MELLKEVESTLSQSLFLKQNGTICTEAEQIIQSVYKKKTHQTLNRMELYSHRNWPSSILTEVKEIAKKRSQGEILQYLLGETQFFDDFYQVNPSVLVPRPETEFLVECAAEHLQTIQEHSSLLGLEVGVGSGIISVELLKRFLNLRMMGSDISEKAIELASLNAEKILKSNYKRLLLLKNPNPPLVFEVFENQIPQGSLVDFVISNPPYLSPEDEVDEDVLRYEPSEALFAPSTDALYFYRKLASLFTSRYLSGHGMIFCEIPSVRSQLIKELFQNAGWPQVQVYQDLAGRDRVLVAQKRTLHG